MRQIPERRFYLLGHSILHAKPDSAPQDAREITPDEARSIKEARAPVVVASPAVDVHQGVDLSVIQAAVQAIDSRLSAIENTSVVWAVEKGSP